MCIKALKSIYVFKGIKIKLCTPFIQDFDFKCEECSFETTSRRHMEEHKELWHRDGAHKELLECNFCTIKLPSKMQLTRHINKIHAEMFEDDSLKCPICGKLFSRIGTLSKHIDHVHFGEGLHECPRCERGFRLRRSLDRHSETCGHIRCNKCEQDFGNKLLLLSHVRTVHPDECYRCPHCKKPFLRPETVKEHIRRCH